MPLPSTFCCTVNPLPAARVRVLPGLAVVAAGVPTVLPPAVMLKPLLLMALAISPAVTSLLASAGIGAITLPAGLPPVPSPTVNEVVATAAFSWSSVAARPLTMVAGFQEVLVRPVTVPAVPSILTGLPPVAGPMFTTSAREKPIWLSVTVVLILASPAYLTVSPSFTVSSVPLSAPILKPASFRLLMAVLTLSPVTALLSPVAMSPLVRLVILPPVDAEPCISMFLPLVLMPLLLMTGPLPLMLRLSAVRSALVATVMSLPVLLSSMFLPLRNFTVLVGSMVCSAALFTWNFQPAAALFALS